MGSRNHSAVERNVGARAAASDGEHFRLQHYGSVTVLTPASSTESFGWELSEEAAKVVLEPLRTSEIPLLVVDLSHVTFFGSVFLSMLLRWWKYVAAQGGTMVLAGASGNARELLRVTALDTLWAIYDTPEEAIDVLNTE